MRQRTMVGQGEADLREQHLADMARIEAILATPKEKPAGAVEGGEEESWIEMERRTRR